MIDVVMLNCTAEHFGR